MIIGVVDFRGQAHCLEHASTVSSYSHEVYDYSTYEAVCWCGAGLHSRGPAPAPHSTHSLAAERREALAHCEQCGSKSPSTRTVLWFRPNPEDCGYARICLACRQGA